MKALSRVLYMALGLALCALSPQRALAAFAPSSVGNAIEKTLPTGIEQVRRGGGGRGFGMRSGGRHFGGFRGGPRWSHGGGRRHWGSRRGWRGVGWGVGIGAPLGYYGYSCIRRGWVWNGYRYVWRRYRVC